MEKMGKLNMSINLGRPKKMNDTDAEKVMELLNKRNKN